MKVQIIIGSTRPGRVSTKVAAWAAAEANTAFDEIEMIDLQDYTLPFFDELISPQYNPNREPTPEVKKWLDKVAEADAYILVSPEYNRATSAVLKNALDHLDYQLAKKPVALIGHGSMGGESAVTSLRFIVPAVQAITIPTAVYLAASGSLSEEGVLSDEIRSNPYGPQTALTNLVSELKLYAEALAPLRAV